MFFILLSTKNLSRRKIHVFFRFFFVFSFVLLLLLRAEANGLNLLLLAVVHVYNGEQKNRVKDVDVDDAQMVLPYKNRAQSKQYFKLWWFFSKYCYFVRCEYCYYYYSAAFQRQLYASILFFTVSFPFCCF